MATVNTNTGGGFWSSPAAAALITGGINAAGGLAQGLAQGKRDDQALALQQQQMAQQQNNNYADAIASFHRTGVEDELARDRLALEASQLDPLAQWRSRARAAMTADIAGQATPVGFNFDPASGMGSYSGGLFNRPLSAETMSFLSPEARANSEIQDFRSPLAKVNPKVPLPNLQSLGYAPGVGSKAATAAEMYRRGVLDDAELTRRTEKDAVMRALTGDIEGQNSQSKTKASQVPTAPDGATIGPDGKAPKGYEFDKKTGQLKKKGGSWWKKALMVAGLGAATVATAGALSPVTGPAMAGVIAGAGTGALGGALNGGGWKGAALGAGLGAASGGIGAGSGAITKGIANAGVRTAADQGIQYVGNKAAGSLANSLVSPQRNAALMEQLRAQANGQPLPYATAQPVRDNLGGSVFQNVRF